MKFIADLQIHSKYSRATSPEMVIEKLAEWAKIKGIKVMGTGDFTHPLWIRELKQKLEPAEPGLFKFRDDKTDNGTRFMLTAETSHIYSQGNPSTKLGASKTRRVHLLIFAPSFEAVDKISAGLTSLGANLMSDGRPIMGVDSKELTKVVLEADPRCMVIPAHAWTPWFSVFGSMSGFDTLEECFGDLTKHIKAIETGLSSDPAMNWRLSQLDKVAVISNSDSHSLTRIGREANVFDTDLSYDGICNAIVSKNPKKFLMTIEFFPEEGKYHYDGHRLCQVRWSPEETKKHGGKCSKCGRRVTVGVLSRVEELADRPAGYKPAGAIPFKNLVPLDEIIGEALDVGPKSKKVNEVYQKLCRGLAGELELLLDTSLEKLSSLAPEEVVEGIRRVREGKLLIDPGFDGEYGKVKIFSQDEREMLTRAQKSLF